MDYLKDFLSNNEIQPKIYEILEISKNEAEILKILTKSYMDGNLSNSVHNLLLKAFGKDNYRYLNHLDEIKNLLDFGYIVKNVNFFKSDKKASKLSLLHTEIELSDMFLNFLESGEIDNGFPDLGEYSNHLEYLQDQFLLVEFYQKRLLAQSREHKIRIDKKINTLKNIIKNKLKISKINIVIEQIFKQNFLNEQEQIIFLALLKEEYSSDYENLRDINTLLDMIGDNEMDKIKNRYLLEDSGNLISNGLIDYDEVLGATGGVTKSFFINEDILQSIMYPQKNDKKSKKLVLENLIKDSEIFELITPKTDINDVVLNPKIKQILDSILKQLDKKVINKLNSWGIKTRKNIDAKIIFYGPAGTGKTMSAISLAKSLKKDVISFDCSKILSKYVGESEQNVRKIFDTFKQICSQTKSEPLLLLNEADQFLSSRLENGLSGAEKMHNQMQNIFLEQIEKFEGVLVATTNFLQSLDSAFSRRFDFKIEFKKPNFQERIRIWQQILPENASFEESFSIEKLAKFDLSGAQISLILKNTALKVAVREDEIFKMSDFIEEIQTEQISAFGDEKRVGIL
ncbi:ATP-binding protein [Campylobacter sp. FMV-PI01]|uniref:ATP-binding protein n=1 Tax=Campylobacter portucalensis TaxID=2608384 RepID=A0A6L5WFT7_9BACT|nr:ATP-binding protein [Campylobacter portucalensis]MSN95739.1 ATP-binding protein [Campylobacter portucalensis]